MVSIDFRVTRLRERGKAQREMQRLSEAQCMHRTACTGQLTHLRFLCRTNSSAKYRTWSFGPTCFVSCSSGCSCWSSTVSYCPCKSNNPLWYSFCNLIWVCMTSLAHFIPTFRQHLQITPNVDHLCGHHSAFHQCVCAHSVRSRGLYAKAIAALGEKARPKSVHSYHILLLHYFHLIRHLYIRNGNCQA